MDAHRWIDALPLELAVQARLLHALVAAAEADPRWEALELGCSLASGRADGDSDVDVGLWHSATERPSDEEVEVLVRGLGEVIEVSAQPWNGVPRWWAQYADGGQLDLVVLPAAERPGRPPGSLILLDAQHVTLPPNIELTYPSVAPAPMADAAMALARLLPLASQHCDPALSTPLTDYVTLKLAAHSGQGLTQRE